MSEHAGEFSALPLAYVPEDYAQQVLALLKVEKIGEQDLSAGDARTCFEACHLAETEFHSIIKAADIAKSKAVKS